MRSVTSHLAPGPFGAAPSADPQTRAGFAESYAKFVGGYSALLLFNQFSLGTNISLIWLLIPVFPLLRGVYGLPTRAAAPLAWLGLLIAKFLFFANGPAVLRYAIYSVFVVSVLLSFRRRDFQAFFSGFEVGLAVNVVFATVQMAGELTHAYHAVLNPKVWNPSLWHANPPGGMFRFWPRVSGFTNEPAYLGMLFTANAAYRIFVAQKKTLTGLYGLYFLAVMVVLVNSRTSFYTYLWLALSSLLLHLRGTRLLRPAAVAAFVASFLVMPIYILHVTADMRSLQELLREDVSIFARAIPLKWAVAPHYLNGVQHLFGVGDYTAFASRVPIADSIRPALVGQGMFSDSKSLGGAYFYDCGLVGTVLLVIILGYFYRWREEALLLFSTVNIGFFNVYAFSWPLFWLLLLAGALALPVPPPPSFGRGGGAVRVRGRGTR